MLLNINQVDSFLPCLVIHISNFPLFLFIQYCRVPHYVHLLDRLVFPLVNSTMFVYFFKIGFQHVLLLDSFQHVRLFFTIKIPQCSFIWYLFLCSFIRYLRVVGCENVTPAILVLWLFHNILLLDVYFYVRLLDTWE